MELHLPVLPHGPKVVRLVDVPLLGEGVELQLSTPMRRDRVRNTGASKAE